MNYQKKTVRDIDVKGKKVLLRCDFNVPQDKKTGAITSDKRIVAALPTIRYLLDQGAAVIACSHLGKPQPDFDKWVKKQTEKGKDPAELTEAAWSKEQKKLTLAPVAARLAELLGQEVIFASDVVGEDAQAKAAALQPGQVLLLENTRFEKGETKNDPAFAQKPGFHGRGLRVRRLRRRPPGSRLHRRCGGLSPRRLRLPDREGAGSHRRRAG